ncbi:GrpB family protein [Chitinimonas lacunae]|uniref:GrpB family protein n=1 Tax=Chitinimonas lacunae TaxID=1963018 RepID=A0ABV8MT06_9NEIS
MLGLPPQRVELHPSHPDWPAAFVAEAVRLAEALVQAGLPPFQLEHIGSTAVPGLIAKPILDLLGGAEDFSALAGWVAALEKLGYTYKGEFGIPGRHLFVLGERTTHHLHLVISGGRFWRDHLAFRDALRADPVLRESYAELKRDLAQRHRDDRSAYSSAKGDFIAQATARAVATISPQP